MRRSARTVAAGRAIATALPAGPLVVLWASPAQAHAEHASTGHGPVWVPVLAAVVGGWFLASPSRRRSPVAVLAAVLLLVGPSRPGPGRRWQCWPPYCSSSGRPGRTCCGRATSPVPDCGPARCCTLCVARAG